MSITSKTGLTPTIVPKIRKNVKVQTVQLGAIARAAPFILKPFAGLYNPYPYGCSLLCNHPTDHEAKELLRKAKNTWAIEGRNLLLAEEIEAIRESLRQISYNNKGEDRSEFRDLPQVESVPEELFRRYTETDSRPLTPAPTLASAATRASDSRRCVTPDPIPTSKIREKTLLVLDLRRSHSQETLSWYGSSSANEAPLIRIQRVPTRTPSCENLQNDDPSPRRSTKTKLLPVDKPAIISPKPSKKPSKEEEAMVEGREDDGEDVVRRRGKKKRKRGRDASRGPPPVATDPETQVAAVGPGLESRNESAKPPNPSEFRRGTDGNSTNKTSATTKSARNSMDFDSYLDVEILKHFQRELNEDVVDNEFNNKRRLALIEAFKAIGCEKAPCEELVELQKELNISSLNSDLWLNLPRIFSRSSARFELPLDSRSLRTMTPLEYLKDNVSISSSQKLLYNCIFNKFKIEQDGFNRQISGEKMQMCLDLVMGKRMNERQAAKIRRLVNWNCDGSIDFKTFCGVCALTERLFAPEYFRHFPDRKTDPCHELEDADFQSLTRKLHNKKVDPNLVEILEEIQNS